MKKITKVITIIAAVAISIFSTVLAQVSINTDGSQPDASAMLDVKSTSKGLLPPRMTESEIELIANPANGLMVFNTTNNTVYIFVSDYNEWKELNYGSGTIDPQFSCGNILVDGRDDKSYITIQIGTQCWMAENLNVGTMINGSEDQTDNDTIEKYCYGDETSNCDTYGGLYQWNEMMQYTTSEGAQGLCPDGWHLPSDNEWKIMEMVLGMSQSEADGTWFRGTNEGEKMKSTSGWYNNGNGTNTSGFSALPGGERTYSKQFRDHSSIGHWWTSSGDSSTNAFCRALSYDSDQVYRGDFYSTSGYNVRCLKD